MAERSRQPPAGVDMWLCELTFTGWVGASRSRLWPASGAMIESGVLRARRAPTSEQSNRESEEFLVAVLVDPPQRDGAGARSANTTAPPAPRKLAEPPIPGGRVEALMGRLIKVLSH